MVTSARQPNDTDGRRLILIGVSFAFACGFASLGAVPGGAPARAVVPVTDVDGADASGTFVAAPSLGAAHSDPVVDPVTTGELPAGAPTGLPTEPEGDVRVPAERVRAFAADVGDLAWQAVHGGVNGGLWRGGEPLDTDAAHGPGLAGIGFPGIAAAPTEGMRVYRPLVDWGDVDDVRRPIARVRCMGLSPAAIARRAARYEARIVELAMAHGVSASLVKAVITEESCFDPDARSPVGAIGLMQLMPATAAWLGVEDPTDPDANLRGGIRYLARLRARYGDTRLALAAYNAGPGNVDRYDGVPPFAETRRYVVRVAAHHRRYVAATALAAR